MPSRGPRDDREQRRIREKDQIVREWQTAPRPELVEDLWHLAMQDESVADLVAQAFETDFAEEFVILTTYRCRGGYPPYFYRVIGATLEWLPNFYKLETRRTPDPAVIWNFLAGIASGRSDLTLAEMNLWISRLLTYVRDPYNFLGSHGITEAIPQLEEVVCTLPNGSQQTVVQALINGYEPKAVYNLLRLQAIEESRQKRTAKADQATA